MKYIFTYLSVLWEIIKEPTVFIAKLLLFGGWLPYMEWQGEPNLFLDHPHSDWFWMFPFAVFLGWSIVQVLWSIMKLLWSGIKLLAKFHKNIHKQVLKKTKLTKARIKSVKRNKRKVLPNKEQVNMPVEEVLEPKTRLESV